MINFIIGLFCGCFLGILITGLTISSKMGDELIRRTERREEIEAGKGEV